MIEDLAQAGPMGLISADQEEAIMPRMKQAAARNLRGRPRKARPINMRARPENLSDQDLLERAIRAMGDISDKAFAEEILYVNPRTLRKYREGRPLNRLLREKLEYICYKQKAPAA